MIIIDASVGQLAFNDWAKTVLQRGKRGVVREGVHEVESHRPLISNDFGSQAPRLHGCVVPSIHSRLRENQPSSGTETTFTLWIRWQHNTLVDIRCHYTAQ